MLGIGVGGTAEKAMVMAKEALMERSTWPSSRARAEEQGRGAAHRALRQGQRARHRAQGLGGLSTVLDVKINTYPTHAANSRSP